MSTKEKFTKDRRKNKFNVTKEYISVILSGHFVYKVLVTNVRSEGINDIKNLEVGPGITLRGGEEVRTEGDSQELVIKTLLGQTGLFIYYESIKRELERQTCCETIKRERTGEKIIFFLLFFLSSPIRDKALIPTRLCSRFWRLRFLPHL